MFTAAKVLVSLYLFIFVCWILYLALMSLPAHRSHLTRLIRFHGYVLYIIGRIFDLVLNVLMSVPFLDPPRELTFTKRLKRYHANPGTRLGWRAKLAEWICDSFLNPFDPTGGHC